MSWGKHTARSCTAAARGGRRTGARSTWILKTGCSSPQECTADAPSGCDALKEMLTSSRSLQRIVGHAHDALLARHQVVLCRRQLADRGCWVNRRALLQHHEAQHAVPYERQRRRRTAVDCAHMQQCETKQPDAAELVSVGQSQPIQTHQRCYVLKHTGIQWPKVCL